MTIDVSTTTGMLRLRCADVGDLPYLPNAVYEQALLDAGGNMPQAAKTCSIYILGLLSQKTRRRLNQLEVYGEQVFQNYREFLLLTVSNPAFMNIAPIPYSSEAEFNHIQDFQTNWNKNFYNGSESQSLAFNADLSPNDGSRSYPNGTPTSGWTLL